MGLLDRLRAATAADLGRDAAEVLGLRPGQTFEVSKEALTVGGESVPFALALAELERVLAEADGARPRDPARPLVIADLEAPRAP